MPAPAAGAPPAQPKNRVRGLDVLGLPRVGLPAAVFPDRRWRNGARYDDVASGSTQFLSRDPMVASTRSPYGYVYDNPLNGIDPSGLCWGPDWACNAVSDAAGAVGGAASTAWNDTASAVSGAATWANNTSLTLPNSRFFTGTFNLLYGSYKVGSGIFLVTAGTAADVTGIGALLGVPAQTYGVYQLITGAARMLRGGEQLVDAAQHPTECKTPVHYAEDTGLDVVPGGSGFEHFLGGLP